MVEFGGWDMPIQYGGVLQEHRACREGAVVFDVSHLGTVRVTGDAAFEVLQQTFTNDLNRIAPGRAQYTHLLDPVDAHVVDDIIVWWVADNDFFVMPNASNTSRLTEALSGTGVVAQDITSSRVVLAVQGPNARKLLRMVGEDAATVGRFCVTSFMFSGVECVAAGTGYTGEDGVEIHAPVAVARNLWDAILEVGIQPAGLGARDTLRLEAGLPLHGHELGEGITPLQANLGWVVRFDKGSFRGSDALLAERDMGVARILRGIAIEGRQPARAGAQVFQSGLVVGEVTSGNFSVMLGHAIAIGFLKPSVEIGEEVSVDVRGNLLEGKVVALPFVAKH